MKSAAWLAVFLTGCATAWANDGMFIPWEEFKSLYRQSVERELLQQSAAPQKAAQVYSIDEARYRLIVSATGAQGEVTLSGRVVSGGPDLIPMFDNEIAISDIQQVAGGTFLTTPDTRHLAFLPDANAKEFHVVVAFLLRQQEENGARALSLAIPSAARNSLELTLPPDSRLAEEPGIADAKGVFHFAARPQLSVKYFDKKQSLAPESAVIEIDTVTRIRVEKRRLMVSTFFQPMRPAPESLALHAPPGAQYVASSLKASRLTKSADDRYEIGFPANDQTPFSMEFAIDGWVDKGEVAFPLPVIEGNTGAEGRFAVEEPDDGQVTVTAEGLISRIPVEKLGEALSKNAGRNLFYMKAPPAAQIRIAYKPFQTVSAPATVLDSQGLFVSFEENGNVLSVLRMDVPPEVGARMKLKAVPDAEIWSLTVNNVKQSVYAGEQGVWILPLDGTQVSHVELAFLRRGQKLALQGALEAFMPETGLPSRELYVGIALPPRVNLLSLEGPVSPASGEQWQPPAEFLGKPHFFSRSFYKGEGINLTIAYKEPVNPASNRNGEKP
ncbi:MAG: hypothetical protein HZB26_22370 [Candidatus Hydrogenedentes bacterium]|nr:hypothetical protein [Candidatus Hydrogenedentota bacterium]